MALSAGLINMNDCIDKCARGGGGENPEIAVANRTASNYGINCRGIFFIANQRNLQGTAPGKLSHCFVKVSVNGMYPDKHLFAIHFCNLFPNNNNGKCTPEHVRCA